MSLKLGCKARNLVTEIQQKQGENDPNRANTNRAMDRGRRLSITVLSYMADLLATLKHLVSWLDRYIQYSPQILSSDTVSDMVIMTLFVSLMLFFLSSQSGRLWLLPTLSVCLCVCLCVSVTLLRFISRLLWVGF